MDTTSASGSYRACCVVCGGRGDSDGDPMRTWPSPHQRETLCIDADTLAKGRYLSQKTAMWVERNEASFRAILWCCKRAHDNGATSMARNIVAKFCCDNNIKVGDGPSGFDHTVFAGIARYMVLIDPSLEGAPIEFRDSCIDCYGLVPIGFIAEMMEGKCSTTRSLAAPG